jgi:ABC-2 type transport system permease protein
MKALTRSTRAELLRMRKWPAVWILVAAWMALNATFGYLFNYISYRTGETSFSNEGAVTGSLLARLLPEAVPQVLLQGMPLFGGALMMVLGAVVAGSGFGVGTWKTAFTQGPSRVATVGGSIVALLLWVLGSVVATMLCDFCFATSIAAAEGQAIVWPTLGSLAESVGAGLMVFSLWAMAGYFLGVVARGPALSVGLGLVWLLVVENLLRGVGNVLSAVEGLTHVLPGTAAGSLVGAVVDTSTGETTPGVLTVLNATEATATVAVYLVVLPLLVIVLMRQRDMS